MLKHFTISLLSELRQQVKYEQVKMFDEMVEVVEKKEVSMEEIPQPTMQSMVKVVQFLTELEPWKHLEMSFHMELAVEQMINQMN